MTKPKLTTEPGPSPAEVTADQAWHAGEAARRIARERPRAAAYLAVRGGRDPIATRLILERVEASGDREAFRVLVGCRGIVRAAVRLLADLAPATGELADDEEAA